MIPPTRQNGGICRVSGIPVDRKSKWGERLRESFLTLPTAEAGGFLFHRPVAFESVKALQGSPQAFGSDVSRLPLFSYVLCGWFEVG